MLFRSLVYLYHNMDGRFSPPQRTFEQRIADDLDAVERDDAEDRANGQNPDNFSAVGEEDAIEDQAGDDHSNGSDTEVELRA